jgi:hypothetical protein
MVGLAVGAVGGGEAFGAAHLLGGGVERHPRYDDGLLDPDIG